MNIDIKHSLLTKESSNFIKGVLIAFVVFGHNMFITSVHSKIHLLVSLFNVSNFFILVFAYGSGDDLTFGKYLKKISLRMLPYYISTFVVYAVLYKIYTASIETESLSIGLKDYILAIILGGPRLKETTGFLLLWFFPAFYYFLIFKYFVLNRRLYFVVALSFAVFLYFYAIDGYYCYQKSNAIISSLYFLFYAMITNIILRKFKLERIFWISLFLYAAIFVGILFIDIDVLFFLVPGLVFIILFRISKINSLLECYIGKFFIFMGKNSLYIYISHMLFFYILYFLYFKDCKMSICEKAIYTYILEIVLTILFSIAFKWTNKTICNITTAFINKTNYNNTVK